MAGWGVYRGWLLLELRLNLKYVIKITLVFKGSLVKNAAFATGAC